MSLYHIVFLLLLIGVVAEHQLSRTPRIYLLLSFGLLVFLLLFRYGQGTDYFHYQHIYRNVSRNLFSSWQAPELHGEPGWIFLCWMFKLVHAPFSYLVFAVSALECYFLWRFISRYCSRRCLAHFLCYHTLYLTYFFSAMRQAIVISVFLGVLIPFLQGKKYLLYYTVNLLCVTIHSVAAVLLLLPMVEMKLFSTIKKQLLFVLLGWILGSILASGLFDGLLKQLLPHSVSYYLSMRGISPFAILERLISYFVTVFTVYASIQRGSKCPEYVRLFLGTVSFGMFIYGLFLWLPIVASRMSYIFKVVEIGIWTTLLVDRDILARGKIFFCAVIVSCLYVKNIHAYIAEGAYYSHVNFCNYPYLWVFDTACVNRFRPIPYADTANNQGPPAPLPNRPAYDYLYP